MSWARDAATKKSKRGNNREEIDRDQGMGAAGMAGKHGTRCQHGEGVMVVHCTVVSIVATVAARAGRMQRVCVEGVLEGWTGWMASWRGQRDSGRLRPQVCSVRWAGAWPPSVSRWL